MVSKHSAARCRKIQFQKMRLTIVALKKKLSGEPMEKFCRALTQQSPGTLIQKLSLEQIRDFVRQHEPYAIDIEPGSLLLHKPQNIFDDSFGLAPHEYNAFVATCIHPVHIIDELSRISVFANRYRLFSMIRNNTGVRHPPTYTWEEICMDHRLYASNTTSSMVLQKPISGNNHAITIYRDIPTLHAAICRGGEAGNSEAVYQLYIPHRFLVKLYTYRGDITYMECRAPLVPHFDNDAANCFSFDSQSCRVVQDAVSRQIPDNLRERLGRVSRTLHEIFCVHFIGVDVLIGNDDELWVCDVNYFSGPKLKEAESLARALRDDVNL